MSNAEKDIVERLLSYALALDDECNYYPADLMREAESELSRLYAEVEEWKGKVSPAQLKAAVDAMGGCDLPYLPRARREIFARATAKAWGLEIA